ncbi:MAG: DUF3137 domain-containing protein [Candidatus Gastranaerophilales bacterium]|nr:DUF3137 domain-containing protein [Candidatus Gastranaerophilales bacterium]
MQKDIAQMRRELHEFYFYEVKPALNAINSRRKKVAINTYLIAMILIGFILCMIIPIVGVVLIFGGVLLFALFAQKTNKDSNVVDIDFSGEYEIKEKFMPRFLSIFGENFKWQKGLLNYNMHVSQTKNTTNTFNILECFGFSISRQYKLLNLLPFYPIFNIDDFIEGTYQDVNFSIQEYDSSIFALKNLFLFLLIFCFGLPLLGFIVSPLFLLFFLLIDLFEDNPLVCLSLGLIAFFAPTILFIVGAIYLIKTPKFKGVVVEFDMNKNFEGHTFVLENAKTAKCIKFDCSKFEEIKLEDIEFNKKYNVYSNDQIESRYILTTGFMERFLNMKTAFKAKYIRAAFKDGKISIAMHVGKDLFAMGSLNKDTDSNTFTELFDEILSVLELINELKLNRKFG